MSDRMNDEIAVLEDGASDPGEHASPPKWAAVCETFVKQMLANRYLWLVFGCALYVNAQLTFIQWSTARHGAEQFDTLELMAHLLVVIESATVLISMLLLGAARAVVAGWQECYPSVKFPYLAYSCAIQIVIALHVLVQVVLLMYPHNYPQLRAEGIIIPLMLLQRAVLIYLVLTISLQIGWISRFYLRVPWSIAAICLLLAQVAFGYTITLQSLSRGYLTRLNSVFYYGYLPRYLPDFPDLRQANLFHNIQQPYFGAYLLIGISTAVILCGLWLPRAFSQRTVKR
jgi:hypothetical protein